MIKSISVWLPFLAPSLCQAFELSSITTTLSNEPIPISFPFSFDKDIDIETARRKKVDLNIGLTSHEVDLDFLLSKEQSSDSYASKGNTILVGASSKMGHYFNTEVAILKRKMRYDSFEFAGQYPTTDYHQKKIALKITPNSKNEFTFNYSWSEGARTMSDIYLEKGLWASGLGNVNRIDFTYLEMSPQHKSEDKSLTYLFRPSEDIEIAATTGTLTLENKSQWLPILAMGCISSCTGPYPESSFPYASYSQTFDYRSIYAEYKANSDVSIGLSLNDFDGFKETKYKLEYLPNEVIKTSIDYSDTLNAFGLKLHWYFN